MDSDLLPARMVNEFVYCPRLFYLEWVEARFADNDDTRLGQQVHRKVDVESGVAPLPEDGELRRARSVTVSSERLGVIAKLDLIEGDGGAVVPVDYKKGSPQPDGTPWPSDEVQVCLQALLLREQGYQCDHAELWYAETRQRVRVEREHGVAAADHLAVAHVHAVEGPDRNPALAALGQVRQPHDLHAGKTTSGFMRSSRGSAIATTRSSCVRRTTLSPV